MFQALAAVGIGHEQADDIVSKLEAGAVAGAHTWISESSAPHGSEQHFQDGWHAGVRDVATYLLRIADTTAATGRGRAASSATLVAHLQQPASPAPQKASVEDPGPALTLDAKDVLAAAERFPWALGRTGRAALAGRGVPGRRAERGAHRGTPGVHRAPGGFRGAAPRTPGGAAARVRAGQQARLARPVTR
ncbi:hypothetical protein JBE27_03985 [Streptomyces albiflaviniger]|nr:hypothetical protein [Streptomyces albiflaviniger]